MMKTILVAVVLGVTVVAVAQNPAPPAQGQSAAPAAQTQQPAGQSQPPVIKDPNEYNAYVAAVDPKKSVQERISALEAFRTQYPNSVMKTQVLEVLLGSTRLAEMCRKLCR
jgi:hypothetical protein